MWRHVTSRRRIFTKLSGNVSLINIMFVSKYEVISIIPTEIMNNNVILGLIWKRIGKFYLLPHKKPITFILRTQMIPNIHKKCKTKFD